MNRILAVILLMVSMLKADNISYCGLFESSEFWRNDNGFLDLNLSTVQRLSYGLNIREKQQRITFLAEYTTSEYNTKFLSFGVNWLDTSKNFPGQIFDAEIGIGPQLVGKYTSDGIEAFYLTPSLAVNVNTYFSRLGYVLTGDIGYNFVVSQNGSKTDQNLRMQSDLSVRLGVGVLFNLSTRKMADDFE